MTERKAKARATAVPYGMTTSEATSKAEAEAEAKATTTAVPYGMTTRKLAIREADNQRSKGGER
jgi:hypothetical protein